MSKVDDELTRRLVRSLPRVTTDDVLETLVRRRRRQRNLQRLRAGALAAAVLAATTVGFVALSKTFGHGDRGGGGLVVSPVPIVPKANGLLSFADGSSVFTVSPTGGSDTRLRGIPEGAWLMAWSPDGSRLAVAVFPPGDGPRELWVADADGAHATRIASADNISRPNWSPDGSLIVYAADTADGSQIHVINADGTDDMTVGEAIQGRDYFSAAFSPDGTRILFDKGTDSGFGIFVMDVGGTHVRRLSQGSSDYNPSWSPSGEQIVFTRQEAGMESDIFVMDADGSSVRRLTDGPSGDTNLYPTFSPDGTKIAYVSGVTGGPGGLVVMNTDGTSPHVLVEKDVLGIAWQPLPTSAPSPQARSEGRDIGLSFNLCHTERLGDVDWLGDGTKGTAWTGTELLRNGECPTYGESRFGVAADITGDGLADLWSGQRMPYCVGCEPWKARDLNGDGRDELIVILQYGTESEYGLYSVGQDAEGNSQVGPFLVGDPGHRAAGFVPGEPFTFWAGGDEGRSESVYCDAFPIYWLTSASSVVDGGPESKSTVHETKVEIGTDGIVRVLEARTVEGRYPEDFSAPYVTTGPACGIDFRQ